MWVVAVAAWVAVVIAGSGVTWLAMTRLGAGAIMLGLIALTLVGSISSGFGKKPFATGLLVGTAVAIGIALLALLQFLGGFGGPG